MTKGDQHLTPFVISTRASGSELPPSAQTRSGVVFSPQRDDWSYVDGVTSVHLDFKKIRLPGELREALKRVLLWYAEHRAPSHLVNMFSRFEHFTSTIEVPAKGIVSAHLMNYGAALPSRRRWYLTNLRGPLKRWFEMGYAGVSPDAYAFLCNARLKGNLKGEAVLTMDPRVGRFTDIERQALTSALLAGRGKLALDEIALCWLFLAIGPRPVQFAALKLCDLRIDEATDGSRNYILAVPRAKQRDSMARTTFTDRPLTREIGELLEKVKVRVEHQFATVQSDVSLAPFFPVSRQVRNRPPGFAFHRTGNELSVSFRQAMAKLNVHSERTGKRLNICAVRCRRTIGCVAAEEGHGLLVIAGLLDQKDTQNTGVYIEASPSILERIDKAMAFRMAPLAQAFAGTLIEDESKARRARDPASRIADPRFDGAVGNCGHFGFCGALAPVACYTCREFQPWLDGPHEAVLDFLIAERDKLVHEADIRIAAINDLTIIAVAKVVLLCSEQRRKKR